MQTLETSLNKPESPQGYEQLMQGWTDMVAKAFASAPQAASPAKAPPVAPDKLLAIQQDYVKAWTALWQQSVSGEIPAPSDRRFTAGPWVESPMYRFLADAYLLNAQTAMRMAESVEGDKKTRQKVKFAVGQWVDAMSPANFLATNPEAQQKLRETKGESLSAGIDNLLADMRKGRMSMTDETKFEVGKNMAVTPGSVVYENDLIQVIQYKPATAQVASRPLLMIPPCINKFYILDLQPENSLIRYTVEQGITVFVVSWRNPTEEQGKLTWDDYIEQGPLQAMKVVREISGQDKLNMLGFCVGGTLVGAAIAVLEARDQHWVESLTLLTTLLDFSETGILDVFIDEASVRAREKALGKGGLMPARDLATTFAFLRPNDLVWNYVVGNYLKGETPPPFDLLYWNADSTNLPGPFFCWYLRNTYLENKLMQPGKTTTCGVPVDLGRIKVPTFVYGSREDHIVPWKAAYASTQIVKGKVRFVLGASGHIAGVINPPAKGKRNYWVTGRAGDKLPADPDAWFTGAKEVPGSWWPEWTKWLAQFGGKPRKAPARPGNAKYKPIEPAPGRYVKARAA